MKAEDYKNLITEMVSHPDTAAETATKLIDLVKEDSEIFENLSNKVNSQSQKIRDLQDTNTKLFLSVTGQADDDDDDEKSFDTMSFDEFAKGILAPGKE